MTEITDLAPAKPGFRWGQLLVWTGVIALLVLVGVGLVRRQQGAVQKGQPAPDFTITSFDTMPDAGVTFKLSEHRGQVVLVNFWASWCIPCRQEARELEAAWQLYKDRGVIFVGVDWADSAPKALSFINEFGQTYFNGPDLGTKASQAYRITGVPETYLIDQNGILVWAVIQPTSLAELQRHIEPLLAK